MSLLGHRTIYSGDLQLGKTSFWTKHYSRSKRLWIGPVCHVWLNRDAKDVTELARPVRLKAGVKDALHAELMELRQMMSATSLGSKRRSHNRGEWGVLMGDLTPLKFQHLYSKGLFTHLMWKAIGYDFNFSIASPKDANDF